MTDAVPSTDQATETVQPAASTEAAAPDPDAADAEPQADAESADGRTYRQRLIDALADSIDAGPQSVAQLMAATSLNRNAVDSTLSVAVKRGIIERVEQGLYRLAPPKPAPVPVPTPAETPRADGISLAQWVLWLHHWANGAPWQGPGKSPDRETGIMVAGGGCLVPLAAWSTFLGERDALAKQQEADDALRARLAAAAFGNVHPQAKLGDLTAIRIMLASGIEVDLIEMAVRTKHDRRMYPKNPPLASWPDLFPKVADLYARSVLAARLVARWNTTLADRGATTAASPTLKRAMSEIASEKAARAPEPVAAVPEPPAPEVAPAAFPQHVAAIRGDEEPSAAARLLERYGGGLHDAVEAVSGGDDAPPAMPASRPAADGRDQILARFARPRPGAAPAAPPPVRADRDDIAGRLRDRRQADGAHPVTSGGGRAWFANPQPEPPSPATLAYDELVEAFAVGNLTWSRSLWGPPPNEPGTRVPVGIRRKYGFA